MVATRKVISVAVAVLAILAIIAMIAVHFGAAGSGRSVRVLNATWYLTSSGYALRVLANSTGRAQLLIVEAGGVHEVAYDVHPPVTELWLRLPVDSPPDEVVLHFDAGEPVRVGAGRPVYRFDVDYVQSGGKVYAVGVAPGKLLVSAVSIPKERRTVVFVYPMYYFNYVNEFRYTAPHVNVTIVPVTSERAPRYIEEGDVLIFADVFPEPQLLRNLVARNKVIVLHTTTVPGVNRFRLVNGSVELYEHRVPAPESDYFGMQCTKYVGGYAETNLAILKDAEPWLGVVYGLYGIVESPYYRLFQEVYVRSKVGDVFLGKTVWGFYYSSVELKYFAYLVAAGFFEAADAQQTSVVEVRPFRGVKPLRVPLYGDTYIVSYASGVGLRRKLMRPLPISHTRRGGIVGITVGIDRYGKAVWNGTRDIKVVEITYDGDVVSVHFDSEVPVPTTIDVRPYSNYTALLVLVDDAPAYVVVDESATERFDVTIENSELCEAFYVTVSRGDGVNTSLFLYLNGRRAAVLEPLQSYSTSGCVPGYYYIEVRNVFGDLVTSKRFRVIRVYEQPLFVATILLAGGVVLSGVIAYRKRVEKEVEHVTLVFYRLPEKTERVMSIDGIVEAISKIRVRKGLYPQVRELASYFHQRYPILKATTELFTMIGEECSKKRPRVGLYSRYVPELDDTVTLIGDADLPALVYDFYTYVVHELLKKVGGSSVPREYLSEVVDVDAVVILGENMLLITYATGVGRDVDEEIRRAVDRSLASFVLIRRMKLPYKLIGFAVLTEPKYVPLINSVIDDILGGNREVAARFLRDMTVFQRISEASRDAWLGRYVMVAAPITRLAPLLAFAKVGAPRICNRYYRFAKF